MLLDEHVAAAVRDALATLERIGRSGDRPLACAVDSAVARFEDLLLRITAQLGCGGTR